MFSTSTDRAWEFYGRVEPYFGVLVEKQYKMAALTDEARAEFFSSGEQHIEQVMGTIRRHFDHSCTFRRALDFGCGTGRLVLPLAQRAGEVVGLDVSASMLAEAAKNCQKRGVTNVTFHGSDDRLSALRGQFDLIHSYIVFQHIPTARGFHIIRGLLAHLESRGIGVLHVTFARQGLKQKWASRIMRYVPFARKLINVAKGRKISTPQMQMNNYNLNRLLLLLQNNGIRDFHAEFTDHGGFHGVTLYLQKP